MAGITNQWGRRYRGWLNTLPLVAFLVGMSFTGIVVNYAYQALNNNRLAEFDPEGYLDLKVFPETMIAEHHAVTYKYPDFNGMSIFGYGA